MILKNLNPVVSVLFSAFFWGIVWYPLRYLELRGLSGPWQMLISYGAAYLILLVIFRPCYQQAFSHWPRMLILALAAGWANIGFLLAILDGTVMRVMLLFYLSPAWTAVIGHFYLRERIRTITATMILVGMAGCLLMLWDPEAAGGWHLDAADWLALTAGFAFAVTNVMTRDLKKVNVVTKTFIAWTGVLMIAVMFIGVTGARLPAPDAMTLTAAVLLGVFGFMLATFAVVYGVSNMPVQASSVILLFEIVVGGVTAWWWAGEVLSFNGWLGGSLIIVSAILAARCAIPNPTN